MSRYRIVSSEVYTNLDAVRELADRFAGTPDGVPFFYSIMPDDRGYVLVLGQEFVSHTEAFVYLRSIKWAAYVHAPGPVDAYLTVMNRDVTDLAFNFIPKVRS